MNSEQSPKSIVSINGFRVSECGYCQSDFSKTYAISAHYMTCQDYQDLIDRGWRRSGKYIYKPNLRDSCCRQYTIRLDTSKFKLSKSQRKIINKFDRYIQGTYIPSGTEGAEEENDVENEHKPTSTQPPKTGQKNRQGKPVSPADWIEMIHAVEEGKGIEDQSSWKHKFKIVMEPSSFTQEEYNLYCKYQVTIHGESPYEQSIGRYRNFLVESPLLPELSLDNSYGYGSFHQKYYIDDKLVAVAVLDFLPKCVSSVYFMYDPDYSFLGLGKYSALREIALTNELGGKKTDDAALKWYYMGFYIHTCQKMKYKGQYRPSDLLDPETYEWYPIEKCLPLLDKEKYIVFSQYYKDSSNDNIKKNATENKVIKKTPPGMLDPSTISKNDLKEVTIRKFSSQPIRNFETTLRQYYGAVGPQLAKRMVLYYN